MRLLKISSDFLIVKFVFQTGPPTPGSRPDQVSSSSNGSNDQNGAVNGGQSS